MQSRGRYYSTDFAVSHVEWLYENPFLPCLIPSARVVIALFFGSTMVTTFWIFGIRWALSLPLVTAIYGYIYFSNRIDNY